MDHEQRFPTTVSKQQEERTLVVYPNYPSLDCTLGRSAWTLRTKQATSVDLGTEFYDPQPYTIDIVDAGFLGLGSLGTWQVSPWSLAK